MFKVKVRKQGKDVDTYNINSRPTIPNSKKKFSKNSNEVFPVKVKLSYKCTV